MFGQEYLADKADKPPRIRMVKGPPSSHYVFIAWVGPQ